MKSRAKVLGSDAGHPRHALGARRGRPAPSTRSSRAAAEQLLTQIAAAGYAVAPRADARADRQHAGGDAPPEPLAGRSVVAQRAGRRLGAGRRGHDLLDELLLGQGALEACASR